MLFICKQTFPLLSVYIGYHVVTTAQGYNSSSSRSPGESFMTNDSMTASSIKPLPQDFASNATFAALLAPLYHTVTAGEAWVFPSSAKDLGARDMSCECFNPKVECCMPASHNIGPFCMPAGSACCANTFCIAGQACCGGFCCPKNTTCNVKITGSGCCPRGEICSGPAICYDYSSSNCTNIPLPKQECCPADTPYCRDFKPSGLGCYANSTPVSPSIVSWTSAAGTGDGFPSSEKVATSTRTVQVVTRTVSAVFNGIGGFSLELGTANPTTLGSSASKTWPVDWGTETAMPKLSESASSTSKSSVATSSVPVTIASTATLTGTTTSGLPTTSTSTTTSALCFHPDRNSPIPCSTASSSLVASDTDTAVTRSGASFADSNTATISGSSRVISNLSMSFLDLLRWYFLIFHILPTTDYSILVFIFCLCEHIVRASDNWLYGRPAKESPAEPHETEETPEHHSNDTMDPERRDDDIGDPRRMRPLLTSTKEACAWFFSELKSIDLVLFTEIAQLALFWLIVILWVVPSTNPLLSPARWAICLSAIFAISQYSNYRLEKRGRARQSHQARINRHGIRVAQASGYVDRTPERNQARPLTLRNARAMYNSAMAARTAHHHAQHLPDTQQDHQVQPTSPPTTHHDAPALASLPSASHITVLGATARPLLNPRVVSKSKIHVVKGSARVFGMATPVIERGDPMNAGEDGEEGEGEEEEEEEEEGKGLGHVFLGVRENA